MSPVFFADPKNLKLPAEEQAFLFGRQPVSNTIICYKPHIATRHLEYLHLIDGEQADYQAELKIKGGSITPAGTIIQYINEKSFAPLTLYACLDKAGKAQVKM